MPECLIELASGKPLIYTPWYPIKMAATLWSSIWWIWLASWASQNSTSKNRLAEILVPWWVQLAMYIVLSWVNVLLESEHVLLWCSSRYHRCFSSIPSWDVFQMSQFCLLVAIPLDERTSTSKDNIESNSPTWSAVILLDMGFQLGGRNQFLQLALAWYRKLHIDTGMHIYYTDQTISISGGYS